MKKYTMAGMVLVILLLGMSTAVATDTVTRTVQATASPDDIITVSLTVDFDDRDAVNNLAITETIPDGWVVVDASDSGDFTTPGKVTWIKMKLFGNIPEDEAVFTYNITVPADADGIYSFFGIYGTNVAGTNIDVLGDVNVTIGGNTYDPPTLVAYTITNTTITPPQTTSIDVAFSEYVSATIEIEDADGSLVKQLYSSSNVKNPNAKIWDGKYTNGTTVPDDTYTVNVTGVNTTTELCVINTSETITVQTSVSGIDTVTRTLPTTASPDDIITVSLTVDFDDRGAVNNLAITETIPDGWVVVDASDSGDFTTPGKVTWIKMKLFGNIPEDGAVFTYNVTVPADADGIYLFFGIYGTNVAGTNIDVLGNTDITIDDGDTYDPPTLTAYTITNTTIEPPQTTSIDVEFSEYVSTTIKVEDASGDLINQLYSSSNVKNPNAKIWDGTYTNGTTVPDGTYTVNVTMYNSTTGLSSYNNTNTIEVTSAHTATIVSIGSAEGRVGDTVSVSIDITGASAIGAMDINIAYDPSILSGRDVANGSMIENLPDLQVAYHISSGMINISFATYPDTIDGDGELFIVAFDVVGGGAGDSTTTLLKVDAYTTDDPPQSVEVETENGVVNVTGSADITPPTITSAIASPNAILSDGIDSTTLRVNATDDVGITSVTVDLSAIGGSDEQILESAGGDIWETAINTTCDGTFELPVTVSDAAGNPDTANVILTAGPYKYTLHLKQGWNMISLPYNITAVGIGTTQKLGDAITAAGEPCSVVSWFNATSQEMKSDIISYPEGVPQDAPYPITGGQGYFVLVEDDMDFVAAGTLW